MTRTGRPKLELKVQHEVQELKAAYRASTDAVERRRIQAIWLTWQKVKAVKRLGKSRRIA